MSNVHSFRVYPALPEKLACLRELSNNIVWSWDHTIRSLFRRMDRDLWEESNHNPVKMLGAISQERLELLASDDSFIAHIERAWNVFQDYKNSRTWFDRCGEKHSDMIVAYFSAEYGLTECMPIYSGGLGILSGDHVKSASDLGLPFVGVGLLYQQGYFRQYLNADGWQQETYPENDFYNMPINPVLDEEGSPLQISVDFPGRKVFAQIWEVNVGRVPLYLLDTNIDQNEQDDRDITDQLYGGDRENRIKQEIILGIGGMRALRAMGITPTVCHMNEGHSAFLALERARLLMEDTGLSFSEVKEAARAGTVFTTHTPVAAGFDLFGIDLMDKYFTDYYKQLGLQRGEFLNLGQSLVQPGGPFNMALLATHHASYINAVSVLHSKVSQDMWQGTYPNVPVDEIPIMPITNGIHIRSWLSIDMQRLLENYLGSRWLDEPNDPEFWKRIDRIPDEELWATHIRRRERLVAFARQRLAEQLERRGSSAHEIHIAHEMLNPSALTIGFARRFATYKRATLLLRDGERLRRLLNNPERPLQIIFAGKAHPQDNEGKEFIRQIIHFARQDDIRRRIVFIEDYDITVGRHMVEGVDVWLNTPRRPLEASGTSGMKVLANGGLNLSILDGWWDEGYNMNNEVGWAIGAGEQYGNADYQDEVESNALFNLLEQEVVPQFYDRGADQLPRDWIKRVKTSMMTLCPFFNTHRMVGDYAQKAYFKAHEHYKRLIDEKAQVSRDLADFKSLVRRNWKEIAIEGVSASNGGEFKVGGDFEVTAEVNLGDVAADQVSVELYYGPLDAQKNIIMPRIEPMKFEKKVDGGVYQFKGVVECSSSGLNGFTVRILPKHPSLFIKHQTGLMTWE
jgi:glycogen phosphorylase